MDQKYEDWRLERNKLDYYFRKKGVTTKKVCSEIINYGEYKYLGLKNYNRKESN